MDEQIKTLSLLLTSYAPRVAAALVIFFVGRWFASRLTNLVVRLLEGNGIEPTLVKFLRHIIFYALLIVVVLATLNQLGVNTSSFLTVVGAAGLAIGLALKDSLSNFSAGAMLVLFRPFKIGDFITAAGVSGTVREISIFNTELATADNQKIIVPNSSVMNGIITNACAHRTRRIDLSLSIAYTDDLRQAMEILTRLVHQEQFVLPEPAPQVLVADLTPHAVNLACRTWVETARYWDVRASLLEKIKLAFDEAGISIPLPPPDLGQLLGRAPAARAN